MHARLLAEFADDVHAALATDKPVSLSRMVRILQQRRASRDVPMPERLYPILLVDPPWRYEKLLQLKQFLEGAESGSRQIENHYPTMALDEIKKLVVPISSATADLPSANKPAADDSVLFLWVTSPKLVEAGS